MKIDNTPMTFIDVGDVFTVAPLHDVSLRRIFYVSKIDLFSGIVFYYSLTVNRNTSDMNIKERFADKMAIYEHSIEYEDLIIKCVIYKVILDEN